MSLIINVDAPAEKDTSTLPVDWNYLKAAILLKDMAEEGVIYWAGSLTYWNEPKNLGPEWESDRKRALNKTMAYSVELNTAEQRLLSFLPIDFINS